MPAGDLFGDGNKTRPSKASINDPTDLCRLPRCHPLEMVASFQNFYTFKHELVDIFRSFM